MIETIKKFVLMSNGTWPTKAELVFLSVQRHFPKVLTYLYSGETVKSVEFELEDVGLSVTKDVFYKAAEELGFINGYRWGVEYPTNGKKPDLLGDTSVQVRNDVYAFWTCGQVGGLSWSNVFKFKITDVRSIPADTSYLNASSQDQSLTHNLDSLAHSEKGLTNSDWYDYDNLSQIEGKYPNKGETIEVLNNEFGANAAREKCQLLFIGEFLCVYESESAKERIGRYNDVEFRPLDWDRKIKAQTEKNNTIAAVCRACITLEPQSPRQILELAYDKGFLRMPEVES